jgi:tRNA (guanine37-N1)-methyltransferase
VAVLVIAEAVSRLLPGVLGNAQSAVDDSFAAGPAGLLEAPVYTKPASWRGMDVPPVLLSGHHGEIARWRAERSRERTAERRPDLLT